MSFIVLDDKEWCKGIYSNGKLYYNKFPTNLTHTWKYHPLFDDEQTLFAHLWCEGKSISQVCPENLKPQLNFYDKKLDAFYRSFIESKIDLDSHCFFDLVPEQFLLEYCDLKAKIVDSVFQNYKKPDNYSFYLKLEKLFYKIRSIDLNIDLDQIKTSDNVLKTRKFIKSLRNYSKNINYNQFGTKTGRLSMMAKSFPILTLNSDYRSIIKPKNDYFVELDYNAAEARTLLALSGKEQPKEDLHAWNSQKLGISRDQAKKGLFAWLYGSKNAEFKKFADIFDVDNILNQYYDGNIVTNYYGRKIQADSFHALNYLVQSTTSDLVLRQILKIDEYLNNKKSYISFIIHDAVYLDICNSESEVVRELTDIFANNDVGNFPVSVSIGNNFSTLKKTKVLC